MARLIDSSWLQDHLNDPNLIIIDPRPIVKYLGGHIPRTVNLPMTKLLDPKNMSLLSPDKLSKKFGEAGVDADTSIVLCDDYDGQSAAMLAWSLDYLGHPKVALLTTRLNGWIRAGGELLYKNVNPTPKEFDARPNSAIRVLAEDILRNGDAKVLDLRSSDEFQGKVATEIRTGHIPRAINVPWTNLIGSGQDFLRSRSELQEIFQRIGVGPTDKIVTYCSYGPRAAIGYLALQHAGYRDVRVYDGSFHEWAQHGEFPVEGEGLQLQL